jgi:hypothetical protein
MRRGRTFARGILVVSVASIAAAGCSPPPKSGDVDDDKLGWSVVLSADDGEERLVSVAASTALAAYLCVDFRTPRGDEALLHGDTLRLTIEGESFDLYEAASYWDEGRRAGDCYSFTPPCAGEPVSQSLANACAAGELDIEVQLVRSASNIKRAYVKTTPAGPLELVQPTVEATLQGGQAVAVQWAPHGSGDSLEMASRLECDNPDESGDFYQSDIVFHHPVDTGSAPVDVPVPPNARTDCRMTLRMWRIQLGEVDERAGLRQAKAGAAVGYDQREWTVAP